MSSMVKTFLQEQKESSPVYFILSGVTIFGTIDKHDFESVTLLEARISGENVTGKITIPIENILAWGEGKRRISR